MATHTITQAKASEKDFDLVNTFFQALDVIFSGEYIKEVIDAYEEDTGIKFKSIAGDLDLDDECEDEYSDEIKLEYIRRLHGLIRNRYRRVIHGYYTLAENVLDPNENTLCYHPFIARAMSDAILGE